MKMRRNNIVHDQKLVWFPSAEKEPRLSREDPFSGLESVYLHTLPRDISAHVMPIGGTSRARKEFAVGIEPDDPGFAGIIASGLAQRGSHHADLARAVCDFVQQTASRMMREDGAAYELVLLRDKDNEEAVGFDLFGVDLRSLELDRNTVSQVVPLDWATEHNLSTRIEVARQKVVLFSLPREFHNVGATKDSLSQLGGAALARMYEIAQANKDLGYDAKEHIRSEHLALAAATRSTGWSAGQSEYELFTEYYVLRRRLVFERSIILLREGILETLNDTLGRVAGEFGKTAKLVVRALPTLDDVKRAMEELSTGGRTFSSVVDDFSLL